MMVPLLRPDTSGLLLLDRNLHRVLLALLLVLLLAVLLGDFVALGNGVVGAVLLGDIVALGHCDIVAFLLGNLGALLLVVVAGLADLLVVS